jgi:hypothetical protein
MMTGLSTGARKPKGLFVTNRRHVGDAPGGVQTCSREYLALLETAGADIEILAVDVDMRFSTRVRRALRTSPYTGSVSHRDGKRLAEMSRNVDLVFLNQVALASALQTIDARGEIGRKTVLLSHGAEVTDLLNHVRAKSKLPVSGRLRPTPMQALRNILTDELCARRGIAAAICLSPFDMDFERWLGVKNVAMVPRTVVSNALDRKPIYYRFGFLGTLDHAPNLEGLVEVLQTIDGSGTHDIQIRVVGGPERLGLWLAEQYNCISYLGPLAEDTLLPEAATWSAFLNPIFCQARGCSTKLATALGWELPIITTPVGRRGYVFSEGSMIEANSPDAFVEAMLSLVNPSRNKEAQIQVTLAAKSCPSMADNARMIRPFFDMLMRA